MGRITSGRLTDPVYCPACIYTQVERTGLETHIRQSARGERRRGSTGRHLSYLEDREGPNYIVLIDSEALPVEGAPQSDFVKSALRRSGDANLIRE